MGIGLSLPLPASGSYQTSEALRAQPYPGIEAGNARAAIEGARLTLRNAALEQNWTVDGGSFRNAGLGDRLSGATVALEPAPFVVLFKDGTRLDATEMRVTAGPRLEDAAVDPQAACLARRLPGKQLSLELAAPDGRLTALWSALLLDGSNYIRQEVRLRVSAAELAPAEVVIFQGTGTGLKPGGSCEGAPALAGDFFLGIEHPMSVNEAGVAWTPVAAWDPSMMSWPEQHVQVWDLGGFIDGDGDYEVLFKYTEGGYRLEITWAEIIEDESKLALDEHFGATGIAHIDNIYRLQVRGSTPGRLQRLAAMVRADGGTDSSGVIYIRRTDAEQRLRCALPVNNSWFKGDEAVVSAVAGVAPPGGLRRAFLYYLERERAHPYRPFLHYNSWYDIGFFNKYSEQDALGVMSAYYRELTEQRGVPLDSFLFDDGWDDYDSLWDFHSGFPDGFARLAGLSRRHGGGIGVWLSPWGGYGEPRERRLKASAAEGYETNEGGFALSGPKYYARFHEMCLKLVRDYNVNQFKFDGLGRATSRVPGSRFGSDFEAAMSLIGDLRAERSDIFINLTTGTWPSPFWVRTADSIWRGSSDHGFAGAGSNRQQWITYRDGHTYNNIVKASPLYPLNSLMLHGVIYARQANKLDTDPGHDLRDELRSYFATGTQLEELYVTPALLEPADWDELAAAARWARDHALALKDSHWVGGDPLQLEVYGWAGWHPRQAVLTLRNPADRAQAISLDAARVFELPAGAARPVRLASPYADQRLQCLELAPGQAVEVALEPYEVLVFDTGTRD